MVDEPTDEAFGIFLHWLAPDLEQGAKEYLDLKKKLIRLFICKGCAHSSEELADETLDRMVRIVHKEPAKYSKPIALCIGVAKNVWREYIKQITPDPLKSDDIPAPEADADFTEQEEE